MIPLTQKSHSILIEMCNCTHLYIFHQLDRYYFLHHNYIFSCTNIFVKTIKHNGVNTIDYINIINGTSHNMINYQPWQYDQ